MTSADVDRAMVDYLLRWVNSGGGPAAEIVDRFGLSAWAFHRRVLEILDDRPDWAIGELGLSPVMLARMKAVAGRRVWLST
ncbi:nitrile hydratase subunit alpha [Rhodococcoides kyotonense]|nr:nitrile hydratase subunit alpha [Rhodococcus kyotonensis]